MITKTPRILFYQIFGHWGLAKLTHEIKYNNTSGSTLTSSWDVFKARDPTLASREPQVSEHAWWAMVGSAGLGIE